MLCQCPKLTPLQSRFVASFAALAILGIIYWSLSNPHFAYAAELDVDGSGQSRGGADHNRHRIEQERLEEELYLEDAEIAREDDWDDADRQARKVWKRQNTDLQVISGNDEPNILNIIPGETTVWRYRKEDLTAPHASKGKGLPSELSGKLVVSGHQELRRRDVGNSAAEERSLASRQTSPEHQVYISINTCLQPAYIGSGTQTGPPPQLTLYVSMNTGLTTPGPRANVDQQRALPLQQGYANDSLIIRDGSTDLYFAVHAPVLPSNFTGPWNYELAVSIDDFYHQSNATDSFLFWIDSDTNAALLVTDNLTQADKGSQIYNQWLNLSAPFTMFASQVNDSSTLGLEQSYCGLRNTAKVQGSQDDLEGTLSHVQMGMTDRGLGNKPKEQFYINTLNGSTNYQGWLVIDGNSTDSGAGVVGGGGKVWAPVNFTTKADDNCALLFNLSFCSEVAYAVPSNPQTYPNVDNLAALYDEYAAELYKNFNYSLQQIPCNTTSDAQYSLARNCNNCSDAYKQWLCAVTIPRCEDFSNQARWLQPRNVGQAFINGSMLSDVYLNNQSIPMSDAPTLEGSPAFKQTYLSSLATNSSRNSAIIDQKVMPGPYKEVLPCEDLCYSLMQSCPAALGFGCPLPGRGLEVSYGKRYMDGDPLSCSYLGAVYYFNGAGGSAPQVWMSVAFAIVAGLILSLR